MIKKALFLGMIFLSSMFATSIDEIREANPDFEEWVVDEVYREQLAIDIEKSKSEPEN